MFAEKIVNDGCLLRVRRKLALQKFNRSAQKQGRSVCILGNLFRIEKRMAGARIYVDRYLRVGRLNGINAPEGRQTWLHVKSGVRLTIVVVVRTLDKIGNIMAAQI